MAVLAAVARKPGFRPPFLASLGISPPQSSQKALSGGLAAPQAGQATVGTASAAGLSSFRPHSSQKMPSSGASAPHVLHVTGIQEPPFSTDGAKA